MGYDIHIVVAVRHDCVDKFDALIRDLDVDEVVCLANELHDQEGHMLNDFGPYNRAASADIIEEACWGLDNPDAFLLVRVGEDLKDTQVEGGFYDNPFNLEIVRKAAYDGQPSYG